MHDFFQAGNRKAKAEESSKTTADKGGTGKDAAPTAEESVASQKRAAKTDPKEAFVPKKGKTGEVFCLAVHVHCLAISGLLSKDAFLHQISLLFCFCM